MESRESLRKATENKHQQNAYGLPQSMHWQEGRTGWVTLVWKTCSTHQRFTNIPW